MFAAIFAVSALEMSAQRTSVSAETFNSEVFR
jgi:hypothetical protein